VGREKRRLAGWGGARGAPRGGAPARRGGSRTKEEKATAMGGRRERSWQIFFFILVGSFYRFVIGSLYFAIILTSDVKTLYRNFTNYNNKLLLLLYFYKPLAEFFGYTNLIIV
jgi:hypothetical protein